MAAKAAKPHKPIGDHPASRMPPPQGALNLAMQHHMAGRLAEAEQVYQQILLTDPDQPDALTLLGLIAHQAGQNDVAVDLISKALAIKPDHPLAHLNLGNALKALGKPNEAVNSYRKALAIKPGYVDALSNLGIALKELGQLDEAVASYRQAIALKPDYAEAHNNLGNALKDLGKLNEAEESYRLATTFKTDFALAYQNRADVLRTLGRIDETIACFQKALAINPDLSGARHSLNALQGLTPDSPPPQFVADLFDQYAYRFEHELVNNLKYKMPALLKQALVDLGFAQTKYDNVVDLGCGTGLVAIEFRDLAATLTGIDVSKNMIHEAEAKGLYDRLLIDDLVGGLKHINDQIDLFIAADVFIYVGDLQATFEAVRASAAPNALLVFSTEHTEATDAFVLQDSIRYAHARAYIEALAGKFGFQVVHFDRTNVRKEKGACIPGGIYVLQC